MINRTRDIINLREAARRCRCNAENSEGARAEEFRRLAAEIDTLIATLRAEDAAARVDAAAPSRIMPVAGVAARAHPRHLAAG